MQQEKRIDSVGTPDDRKFVGSGVGGCYRKREFVL